MAALQPRGPGSSSSSTVSVSPAQPLGPNFPITWQHLTWDGREGAEQGVWEHFGARKGWGQKSPMSGHPWDGSTQGHGGDIQPGLSSPFRALHREQPQHPQEQPAALHPLRPSPLSRRLCPPARNAHAAPPTDPLAPQPPGHAPKNPHLARGVPASCGWWRRSRGMAGPAASRREEGCA